MNISSLITIVNTALDATRVALQQIPSLLLISTSSRRPGFSSIIASAKVYADMKYVSEDNDEIVKEFTYNLINRIKLNIQDDGVCFIAIPPGGLRLQLNGANALGPAVLTGSNKNYVFTYGIIR
jgi:hypothetical protein